MIKTVLEGSAKPLKLTKKRMDELVRTANKVVFNYLKLDGRAIVELLFFDEQAMAQTNLKFRGKNDSTDVLSFPMAIDFVSDCNTEFLQFNRRNYALNVDEGGLVMLGTIIICPQVATLEAEAYGLTNEYEFSELYVHGLLHLLGFDHVDVLDGYMLKVQEEVLHEIWLYCRARQA